MLGIYGIAVVVCIESIGVCIFFGEHGIVINIQKFANLGGKFLIEINEKLITLFVKRQQIVGIKLEKRTVFIRADQGQTVKMTPVSVGICCPAT